MSEADAAVGVTRETDTAIGVATDVVVTHAMDRKLTEPAHALPASSRSLNPLYILCATCREEKRGLVEHGMFSRIIFLNDPKPKK